MNIDVQFLFFNEGSEPPMGKFEPMSHIFKIFDSTFSGWIMNFLSMFEINIKKKLNQ